MQFLQNNIPGSAGVLTSRSTHSIHLALGQKTDVNDLRRNQACEYLKTPFSPSGTLPLN